CTGTRRNRLQCRVGDGASVCIGGNLCGLRFCCISSSVEPLLPLPLVLQPKQLAAPLVELLPLAAVFAASSSAGMTTWAVACTAACAVACAVGWEAAVATAGVTSFANVSKFWNVAGHRVSCSPGSSVRSCFRDSSGREVFPFHQVDEDGEKLRFRRLFDFL
ncbi:hypothetical protein MTO96_043596, partial [Rhipicephalus appendiculatus]